MADQNTIDTQQSSTHSLSEAVCKSGGSIQYLLEKGSEGVQSPPPVSADNHLSLYLCGESTFAQIADDIRQAKKSIDIICWGFDPGMMLVRTQDGKWYEKCTIGYLLEQAASRGVTVRVLVWHSTLGEIKQSNMPGYGLQDSTHASQATKVRAGATFSDPLRHNIYSTEWYSRHSPNHSTSNLLVATRSTDSAQCAASLKSEKHAPGTEISATVSRTARIAGARLTPAMPGLIEAVAKGNLSEYGLLTTHASHHQKTLLIDYYEPKKTGYVMGLNSLEAYWDSASHPDSDKRRQLTTHGSTAQEHIPLQDYACRIQGGGVLNQLHANFIAAWPAALKPGATLPSPGPTDNDLAALIRHAPKTIASSGSRGVRAQILRTQPQFQEKSIKAFYLHNFHSALNALYLENQYLYYQEWADHLLGERQAEVKAWPDKLSACKKPPQGASRIPLLHLYIVTPEPEDANYLPRTYDMLRSLGQEGSLGELDAKGNPVAGAKQGQAAKVNDWEKQQTQYQKDLQQYEAAYRAWKTTFDHAIRNNPYAMPPNPGGTKKPAPPKYANPALVRQATSIQKKSAQQLEDFYGLKVSVAMLYTRSGSQAIYIHSKLMIVDNACFTLGSANLSQRSMAADSELNIACDDAKLSRDLRVAVFKQLGGVTPGTDQASEVKAFQQWTNTMKDNYKARLKHTPLTGFIVPFNDLRTSEVRYA